MIVVLGVKSVTPQTLTQRPQLAQLAQYYNTLPSLFDALYHYKHIKTTGATGLSCLTPPPPCCLGTKDHTRVKARIEVLMSGCKVLL